MVSIEFNVLPILQHFLFYDLFQHIRVQKANLQAEIACQ